MKSSNKENAEIELNTDTPDNIAYWPKPQITEDLRFINPVASWTIEYYKVGKTRESEDFVLAVETNWNGDSAIHRFRIDDWKNATYLANHSSYQEEKEITNHLTDPKIAIDKESNYQSLYSPDFLKVGETVFLKQRGGGVFDETNAKLLDETAFGKFYQIITKQEGEDLDEVSFYLKLADGSFQEYVQKFPFMKENNQPILNWNSKNDLQYSAKTSLVCTKSSGYNRVSSSKAIKELSVAGKTFDGDKVYFSETLNNRLYLLHASLYKNKAMSEKDFFDQKAYFVWQDKFGNYLIFLQKGYFTDDYCDPKKQIIPVVDN